MSSRKSISTIAHADDEDDVALHSADQDNVRGGQNYDRGSSRDSGNELPPLPDLPVFRREYNENEYDGPTDFGGGEYSDQEIEEEREFDYSDMQVDDGQSCDTGALVVPIWLMMSYDNRLIYDSNSVSTRARLEQARSVLPSSVVHGVSRSAGYHKRIGRRRRFR